MITEQIVQRENKTVSYWWIHTSVEKAGKRLLYEINKCIFKAKLIKVSQFIYGLIDKFPMKSILSPVNGSIHEIRYSHWNNIYLMKLIQHSECLLPTKILYCVVHIQRYFLFIEIITKSWDIESWKAKWIWCSKPTKKCKKDLYFVCIL